MENTTAPASLDMQKGQKIDVTKTNPNLTHVSLGMGWDTNSGNGSAFDLDASCILLKGGKIYGEANKAVVYFNHLSADGVQHSGDNLTGVGDGDDETINVDFAKVPSEVDGLLFVVNIFKSEERKQNFGMVKNAFIRLYNTNTKAEIAKYDLSEDATSDTALEFAKLYRHNGEWKFEALGVTSKLDLSGLVAKYNN